MDQLFPQDALERTMVQGSGIPIPEAVFDFSPAAQGKPPGRTAFNMKGKVAAAIRGARPRSDPDVALVTTGDLVATKALPARAPSMPKVKLGRLAAVARKKGRGGLLGVFLVLLAASGAAAVYFLRF